MAEKVGALAYDLVMNTVRFERGMKKTRSSLRTLNQNFKKAAHPVQEYEQRMRDLDVALSDKQISPEQFEVFHKQELESLKQKGFLIDKNGKATKTESKLLEDQIDEQKKLNQLKRLQAKLEQEHAFAQKSEFVKRRNRGLKEHDEVMRRLHSRRLLNAKNHQKMMLNLREEMRLRMQMFRGASAGRTAAIAGNFAGFMGASGSTIGGVRALATAGKGMLPFFAAGGMALGAVKAIQEADQLKRTLIDLSVLMDNNEAGAEKLVKQFQQLARKTPLATKQLAEGARQLMSFGRSATKVRDDLERIGIIAGGDPERFRLLVKAFGDVTAAGKLAGQEMRQFTNQGFNPLLVMAEKTGESYESLRRKMEEGAFTAEMTSQTIVFAAENMSDRLTKSMNTVSGQWSKFKGLLSEVMSGVGSGSLLHSGAVGGLKAVNAVVEFGISGVDRIHQTVKDVSKTSVKFFDNFRKFMTEEDQNGPFVGLIDFYNDLQKQHPIVLAAQEKASADLAAAVTRQLTGSAEEYNALLTEQGKIIEKIVEQKKLQSEVTQELFGRTDAEVKLTEMRNKLMDAQGKKMSTYAERLKKNIELQEELVAEEKELARRKKVIDDEKKSIMEVYDLEEKRITELGKKKNDKINEAFALQKKLANMERQAGGPSEDFTAAGADYKFVQQRRNEIRANEIEEKANSKRASQLERVIELLDRLREQNDINLQNNPRAKMLGIDVP